MVRLLDARFKEVSWLKKNRNRRGDEIDSFVILMCFKPNCIYSYPEYVMEYMGRLAPSNIAGKIWKDASTFIIFHNYNN